MLKPTADKDPGHRRNGQNTVMECYYVRVHPCEYVQCVVLPADILASFEHQCVTSGTLAIHCKRYQYLVGPLFELVHNYFLTFMAFCMYVRMYVHTYIRNAMNVRK
eukprot:scpid63943/ scgid16306/ 